MDMAHFKTSFLSSTTFLFFSITMVRVYCILVNTLLHRRVYCTYLLFLCKQDMICCMACAYVLCDKGTSVSYQIDVLSMSDVLLTSSTSTDNPVTTHLPTVSNIPQSSALYILHIYIYIYSPYRVVHKNVPNFAYCSTTEFK